MMTRCYRFGTRSWQNVDSFDFALEVTMYSMFLYIMPKKPVGRIPTDTVGYLYDDIGNRTSALMPRKQERFEAVPERIPDVCAGCNYPLLGNDASK